MIWGSSIISVRLSCQSFKGTMLSRWLARYADPASCRMPVFLLSSVSWSVSPLPSSCLAGRGNASLKKLMPAFIRTYVSSLRLRRAAVSQGRVHHRREETRMVKEGRLLNRHALVGNIASPLPRTGIEAREIWEWDAYVSILSYPPPSYLNSLLMGQSTLFWVIAFCCNLKTHTSKKVNPERKSTVIRELIFWYFPYVARIYIKRKKGQIIS